jgi:DNA-directed RNA polymerase subunit RPC12/RpoP
VSHRWDKYREPEAKKDPNGCPQCGGKVVYRGFVHVECDGDPFCVNWVKVEKLESPLEEEKTQPLDWANMFWPRLP